MFNDPVIGENFFGRRDIIELLLKRSKALKAGYRQNVAIIGHRELGKTSLLRHFLHVLNDPEILTVYVEIKPQALEGFVNQFIRSLLYEALPQKNAVSPLETLTELAEKVRPGAPKTVARAENILALVKARRADEAYTQLFDLTSVIRQETGRSCIVVLDEFHRLGEFGIKNAFSDFGKRIMIQKDTMYLLASSSFTASRKILAEKLSLLFGNFERVYLEPFDFSTAFGFLESRIEPLVLSDSLKQFLVSFTDGHPFFLDTIAERLKEVSLAKGERTVSRTSAGETLLKLFFESQGALNQYHLKLIAPWTHRRTNGAELGVLTALSSDVNKLKELSRATQRSSREVSKALQSLMEHELITKNGVFHRFHNRLFKFWLKEVYQRKEHSLRGQSDQARSFLERIDEMIRENDELLGMDIGDRVSRLFSHFQNDIIELGEKKRKLPHFTALTRADLAGEATGRTRDLIAKSRGRCWVCKITEEMATEKEVMELVRGADKGHFVSPTKVLIALKGCDENAKLLAKEKHVLTLGLSKMNVLMDVYGKPPIIRR